MKQRFATATVIIFSLVAVVVVWLGSWQLIVNSPDLQDWSQRGSFGDMFGAVSALFSGLAFCGLLITISLQARQLVLQNRELEQTRKDLAEQNRQIDSQMKTADLQRFEGTFFQLLATYQNMVSSMSIDGQLGSVTTGRSCFSIIYKEFSQGFSAEQHNLEDISSTMNQIQVQYTRTYEDLRYGLDVYFRNLYGLFSFVNRNRVISDKAFYMQLAKAQLSAYEILLLYYHCLSRQGQSSLMPLVVVYKLLEDILESELVMPQHKDLIGARH